MRKLPTRKLLATIVAGALFIPSTGFALGLGEIEVSSALNQKLRADIELLSATPEDTENIIVKLASRKEFSRAGLDRPYSLSDLRFKAEVIEGVPYIKVSTGSPVREPFLNFLVEIDWPNGHLLREYTVLLDPPVFMTKSTADTAASRPTSALATESRPASSGGASANIPVSNIPAATVAFQSAASKPAASTQSAPATRSTFIPATQLSNNNQAGSYRIKAGDTSWRLAEAMRPNQNVTVPQMMMAMLRTNPEAFINDNINGLKRGYILRVPSAEQIAVLSKADAQAIVKEQWALWREYQQAKSSGKPVSALKAANNTNDSTAAGTDGSDANTSNNAHLAIVSAGADASGAGTGDPAQMTAEELRAELTLARERVETERVEKEALQSRINALEQNAESKNANSSDGLLVVEDKGLSEMQSLNASNDAAADSIDTTSTEAADTESAAAQVTDGVAEGEPTSDITEAGLDETNTETTDTEQNTDVAAADAVFADEVAGEASADKATAAMPEKTESTDTASEQTASEVAQAGPLAQLLNDPKMMAAAGGGLLLIVGLIALMLKRRKSDEDDEPEVQINAADLETLADDIAEEATTEETVVAEQDASSEAEGEVEEAEPEATAEAEAEEMSAAADASRDDVIAEADVYIAYGIYQQAEDLLNKAIAEKPDRIDYRVKLAETHHISKNATALVAAATEIKSLIGDESSAEWSKVMVMGQDLCPDEALFEGEVELDLDASLADSPVLELDAEGDSEENALAADQDLTIDDSTIDDSLVLPEFDTDGEAAEPVEEIEFDIADTGAVDESENSETEFDLDIDAAELDIGSLDDSVENTAEEVAEEETMDLGDIDLGLDEDDAEDVTTSDASESEVHDLEDTVLDDVALEDTAIEDNDLEFNIDDIASTPAEIEVEAEVAEEVTNEVSVDEIMRDEEPAEVVAEEAVAEESVTEEAVADNTVTEMPVTKEAVAEEPAPEVKTIPAANDDSSDEGDFDLSSLDDVDEISTKLDLARAYLDMGDAEGTRGILEEVLIDGNDEQKQEANELLSKLA